MRPIFLVAGAGLALVAALTYYLVAPGPQGAHADGLTAFDHDGPNPLRVLFVGNSFTFYGPLPQVFAELVQAREPDRGLKVRMIAFPNAKLSQHEERGEVASMLEYRGPWSDVVLQDQSRIAWDDPVGMQMAAEALDRAARAAGARTVLYMTWAEAVESEEAQRTLTEAYEHLGATLGATVAPVGRAFFATGALRPKLYGPDGHHPSALGVYLAACVFYATITGESPQGLPYPTVHCSSSSPSAAACDAADPRDVAALQGAAAEVTVGFRR